MILACEACRRRKVRCGGTAPCSTCQRHGETCYFEHNRRRRGPRPRWQRPEVISDSAVPSEQRPTETVCEQPTTADKELVSEQPSYRDMPSIKARLAKAVSSDAIATGHLLHLILVFIDTVNIQQTPILLPRVFWRDLEMDQVSDHLCLAMAATALRFSIHRSGHGDGLDKRLNSSAREAMANSHATAAGESPLKCTLTLAVLSLHELYCGNALQAWADISMAISLHVHKTNETGQREAHIDAHGDTVRSYLGMSVMLNAVGHDISTCPTIWRDMMTPFMNQQDMLMQLLVLLARCQDLCREDWTKMEPAPWASDSAWMNMHSQLGRLEVLHSGDLVFDQHVFESLGQAEVGTYVLGCCVLCTVQILMNRCFLPICHEPAPNDASCRRVDPGYGITQNGHSSSRRKRQQKQLMQFPMSPEFFSRERSMACLVSACRVTTLCRHILQYETLLLPPFLGYSLFLAGLVFLNQLNTELDPTRLDEYVEYLKTIFSVLGTMRSFYQTANMWVDTLFYVHSLGPVPRSLVLTEGSAWIFGRFFRRFPGLSSDPPYCTLNAEQCSDGDIHSRIVDGTGYGRRRMKKSSDIPTVVSSKAVLDRRRQLGPAKITECQQGDIDHAPMTAYSDAIGKVLAESNNDEQGTRYKASDVQINAVSEVMEMVHDDSCGFIPSIGADLVPLTSPELWNLDDLDLTIHHLWC